MKFNEHDTQPYDWENEGVYVIESTDPVEGGQEGVSNRQAKELTRRTRNLHTRMTTAEGEIDALQEQTPIQVEAALRSANTYTDGKDTVLRADMAIADTAAINAAKAYADQVVAALVDNSPEALNTLQELAAALGGDPNFATTVMQAIGERMKTADVTAALAGKASTSHTHTASQVGALPVAAGYELGWLDVEHFKVGDGANFGYLERVLETSNTSRMTIGTNYGYGVKKPAAEVFNGFFIFFNTPTVNGSQLYHTENLVAATTGAAGLMSAADKTKLDALQPAPLAAYKIAANGGIQMVSGPKASGNPIAKNGSGHYIIYHNVGSTNYYPVPTAYGNRDLVCYAFIIAKHSDRVEIGVSNMSGGFTDYGFELVLMPYN